MNNRRKRKAGAIVISYKRPDKLQTLAMLKKYRWSYPVIVLVSDDDPTVDEYRKRVAKLGHELYVFNRESVPCDYYDNMPPSGPLAARNFAWTVAREYGWSHFVVLDDDYRAIGVSYPLGQVLNRDHRGTRAIRGISLSDIADVMWNFLDAVPMVLCVSLAQSGDIGGFIRRKMMQTFFLRTDRQFEFVARMNDDVTTYYDLGLRGKVVLQHGFLIVWQHRTQAQPGGLTDVYRQFGTFAKSMYTVLRWPGHCRVGFLPSLGRCHHLIRPHSYPALLPSQYA